MINASSVKMLKSKNLPISNQGGLYINDKIVGFDKPMASISISHLELAALGGNLVQS